MPWTWCIAISANVHFQKCISLQFMKLVVYFEDLNYEEITEKEEIEVNVICYLNNEQLDTKAKSDDITSHSCLIRSSCLQTKKGQRLKFIFYFLENKIVKRHRRWQHDTKITERTMGLVLALSPDMQIFSLSIILGLTRPWRLHDGPCPNLRRDDKVPSFVPTDCSWGLLHPLDLSSLTDWAEHSLLLWMSLNCINFV